MRDYGLVYTTFWSSRRVRGFSDDGRLLALYLMTSAHSTIAGVFRLPNGYAAEDLQWEPARVERAFAELAQLGFAQRCGRTQWVWIQRYLKWNRPENPNQRKAIGKVVAGIPEECSWREAFQKDCGPEIGHRPAGTANRFGTVLERFRNQDTGTGTGTGTEAGSAGTGAEAGSGTGLETGVGAVPETGTAPTAWAPPLLSLVQLNEDLFHVYPEYAERLQEQFPAVDVQQHLRQMQAWLEANPRNRKTEAGMTRFINNWLSREQDRARRCGPAERPGAGVLGDGDLM